jgi:4-hydroxy 2-oxovalerate aldolase
MSSKGFIRIVDTTLRDGSHSIAHQFSEENVVAIAGALDRAHIDTFEVTHGDGLGGSSIQYGRSKLTDREALHAAHAVITNSKLAVLLLPGVGVKEDLDMAFEEGARAARVATHATEADISAQHIAYARNLGMETLGFLMLSHTQPPEVLVEQAKRMESYGATTAYVVDSAGAMVPDQVRQRVSALKNALQCSVGFHAHNNLGLAIGNSLAAIEEGATVVDGSLGGLGAGAGNAATEVLVAVLHKSGYETGIDLYGVMDAAEDLVRPLLQRPQVIDKAALSLGYAGVYSSFLLHTVRAAAKLGVDPRDILVELGKRRVVGGQEDMILAVGLELAGGNR